MNKQLKIVYFVFCAVIGFMIWSLAYGAILGAVYKDSRIFQITITSNPFAPFIQLWYYSSNATLQKVALMALAPALAVAAIVAFIGLRKREQPLGEAAFQTMADLRSGRWFRKDGHIFGRMGHNILRVKDDRHHLVIGPTRSGKGVGYVIPNALAHEGSMLVTDLKGEIFKSTAAHRQANGNQVFLFAPGQKNTNCWNPMDFIRPEPGNRTTDIQNMAKILVPKTSTGDGGFWQQMAQRIAAGLISYIHESDFYEGRRNLAEINSLLNSGVPVQVLLKYILEKEPYLSRFTRESFNAYIGLPEKTAGSALTELQNALEPFQNERVVAATCSTDIDLAVMNRKPMSIYLAPNVGDINLLRPLLTLFVQQVMNLLTLEHNPNALPVYFLLDEFRQLKKMDEIMTKLPYVAGYKIKLAFIIQDLKNLDEIYGETSRHSLLGNCGYQLILGANDQATADYVSKALGRRTIRYQSESRSIEPFDFHKRTKVEQIRERDLMMPQEVRKMGGDNLVLLVEGQSPIFGEKLKFHEAQPFKAAVEYSEANVPAVPETILFEPLAAPALTEAYASAGVKMDIPWKKKAEKEKAKEQPTEGDKAENTIEQSPVETPVVAEPERAHSQSAVVPAEPAPEKTEIITEDGEILEDEPVEAAASPETNEPHPEFKILAAKKKVQPQEDVFGSAVSEARKTVKTPRKRKALKEVEQTVLATA